MPRHHCNRIQSILRPLDDTPVAVAVPGAEFASGLTATTG